MLRNTIATLSALLVVTTTVSASASVHISTQPVQLQLVDVASFVEGFLYGIMQQEFHNLDSCIGDVDHIAQDVEIAVTDFKKENFDGIKAGLLEMGQAVKLIPTAVSDCKTIT